MSRTYLHTPADSLQSTSRISSRLSSHASTLLTDDRFNQHTRPRADTHRSGCLVQLAGQAADKLEAYALRLIKPDPPAA